MSTPKLNTIPLPLVRTNQWTIFISVILTWITGQYWLLLIPLISGVSGLLFDFHPIIKFAKQFLKKQPSSYPQEDKVQQNFNQTIAVSCLSLAFIGALLGWNILFYVFSIMVALASFIAINGFCVGCYIHFQWNQYKYRKSLR
ncbi:DUF4395 domain-containing protein [Bacillus sp. AFS017336]|uniref:DUF4395 domain-containing protein n=1 Tax=Bacillus sp. AFS017336 TaxID=2033489 RepID=UPI000BF2493A|nr:DUF4395 domain-containing protein [Bacillus sp. AFS017336]PEL11388.1 hypothetical protein CN601_11660 [Bacillus sp. AFS017336]